MYGWLLVGAAIWLFLVATWTGIVELNITTYAIASVVIFVVALIWEWKTRWWGPNG